LIRKGERMAPENEGEMARRVHRRRGRGMKEREKERREKETGVGLRARQTLTLILHKIVKEGRQTASGT